MQITPINPRFGILTFIILLMISSCVEDPTRAKPNAVLTEEEMVTILTDIQLIEGAISKKIINRNITKKESPLYYATVFEKHNISQEQFNESISYYSENPEELQAIYEKVLVELNTIKAKLQNTKKNPVETK